MGTLTQTLKSSRNAEGNLSVWYLKEGKRKADLTQYLIGLHPFETLYLILVILHLHASISTHAFRTFFVFMYIGKHFNFLAIDNDDMKPSKRQEYFVSSISVLKLVYLNFSLRLYYFYNSFKSLNWRGSTKHNCTTSLLFLSKLATLRKTCRCIPYKNSTFITCN